MKKLTKQERSWIMYDWANSSYATIMMVGVFPIYFAQVAQGAGVDGDMWWGYGTSAATLVMAALAPLLGALGDYKGMKKKLFTLFLFLGLVFTAFNMFTERWQMMLLGYSLSYLGFMGANLFYDAFLTDVTSHENMDRISAWGYSMGYIGGSTIPFLMSIALILFGPNWGISNVLAVKLSLGINVLWWAIFSIPMLQNVEQTYYLELPKSRLLQEALGNMLATVKDIIQNKGIFLFMLSYFFYIDGVNTVISMATSFGTTLGLNTTGMILAIMVIQLIAFPCTFIFVRLANRKGTLWVLLLAIVEYSFICLLAFVMGWGIEFNTLSVEQGLMIFWLLAIMVGTCQGGIQALSRSFFGKLVPQEKANEYFGFFDIFGKFAAIMGPAIYGLTKSLTGYSSYAILAIASLFILGGGIMWFGRRTIEDSISGGSRTK